MRQANFWHVRTHYGGTSEVSHLNILLININNMCGNSQILQVRGISSVNGNQAPRHMPISKANPLLDLKYAVEKILGEPPASELSHEYEMITRRFSYMKSGENLPALAFKLNTVAESINHVDRAFFIAYFSNMYENAARRAGFNSQVQLGEIIGTAENEARNGKRFNDPSELTLNQDKGKICESTDPLFRMAFMFRNTFLVSADLPEKEAFISVPINEPQRLIEAAGRLIKIGADGLQALANHCKQFIWKKESLEEDLRNNYIRCRNPNDYWGVFHGVSGENYVVKMRGGTFDIYKCHPENAYAKGVQTSYLPYPVDDGEFNLYSPWQNAFYNAEMRSGKIVSACRSKREPSKDLTQIAMSMGALDAKISPASAGDLVGGSHHFSYAWFIR